MESEGHAAISRIAIKAQKNGAKHVIRYVTQVIVHGEDWNACFWFDRSTGSKHVFLVGDPKAFDEEIHRLLPDLADEWVAAINAEIVKRSDPFRVIPMPGKKKAKEKVSTDQLEVGGTQTPVFGKPETGKKSRKK